MRSLKNCVKLSCNVKIYVPSTVNVNQVFDSAIVVDDTLKFLSDTFGGATASKALGAWITTNGQLVKEPVTLVISYCDQLNLTAHIESVYDYCMKMKIELAQEAIALEVNGELYFV